MSNDELHRETDERIRATIDGVPDSEWDGLGSADVWWVLTDDEEGGAVVEKYQDTDPELTIVTDGGGPDAGEITVDLDDGVTAGLTDTHYWQEVIIRDSSGEISSEPLDPHQLTMKETAAGEVT